jgi:hypothetical protein
MLLDNTSHDCNTTLTQPRSGGTVFLFMPQILVNEPIGEADLTFQIKLSEQIDRLRRILNSGQVPSNMTIIELCSLCIPDIYIPGACKRLAERCEAMLSISHLVDLISPYSGHLKENTVHLPDVSGLENDFLPVFAQCTHIAEFLEETQSLSWSSRRVLLKEDLSLKAKSYTTRIDEISCQVLIQLNIRASHTPDSHQRSNSIDSNDSTFLETGDSHHSSFPVNDQRSKVERMRSIGRNVFIVVFVVGVIWIVLSQQ